MFLELLPGQFVGTDVEASPALSKSDKTCHCHWALDHRLQLVAHLHILNVTWQGTTDLFALVEAEDPRQLFACIVDFRFLLDLLVLGPAFARRIPLGALIIKFTAVDLLDGAAGKAGVMLNQILEPGSRCELVPEHYRSVPGDVDARKHRVNSRKAANVSTEGTVKRKNKRRRCKQASIRRASRIIRVAPEWIVITDTVRPMPDIVAGCFVAPGFERVFDWHINQFAQFGETLLSDN